MALKLKNTSQYLERKNNTDWWEWIAFIDPDDAKELEEIDYVEYRLHPTFKNPVEWVKKKKGGFQLKRTGWGTFLLRAKVIFKDKTKSSQLLEHQLEFEKIS